MLAALTPSSHPTQEMLACDGLPLRSCCEEEAALNPGLTPAHLSALSATGCPAGTCNCTCVISLLTVMDCEKVTVFASFTG